MSDIDALGMSDEAFLSEAPSSFDIPMEAAEEQPSSDIATEETPESVEDTYDEVDEELEDSPETDEEGDADEVETEDSPEETEDAPTNDLDYEAEFKKLLTPFKANGSEIAVKSAEEAITLMQKGANYTKKMQGLQPSLKLLKMLEKNELLDETKLNHLINVSAGNPDAIRQLVKDKGVTLDTDEFGDNESTEYKPKDYTVSTAEMKVAEVLSSIENTPTYARTIDVLGNTWDDSSKQTLSDTPKLIADINEHMSNGIFDKVNAEVQRQKDMGGLIGLSDYEAYMAAGNQINQAGGFNETPKPEPLATTKPVSRKDTARSQKRKAASSTKQSAKKTAPEEFNPLALSDADFLKLM